MVVCEVWEVTWMAAKYGQERWRKKTEECEGVHESENRAGDTNRGHGNSSKHGKKERNYRFVLLQTPGVTMVWPNLIAADWKMLET